MNTDTSVNYYPCDNIKWADSLRLLLHDPRGQRIYSSLWQLTRDVLMLSATLFLPLGLLTAFVGLCCFSCGVWQVAGNLLMPFCLLFPLTWTLGYLQWYRWPHTLLRLIYRLLQALEVTACSFTSPVSCSFRYAGRILILLLEETERRSILGPRVTSVYLLLPHLRISDEQRATLFPRLMEYLKEKQKGSYALFSKTQAFRYPLSPFPDPQDLRRAVENMIYLADRYGLLPDEEMDKENCPQKA